MSSTTYAPGRVNIIGEHTDYTGGFSLPMAIQLGIEVHASERDDELVTATSDSVEGEARIPPRESGTTDEERLEAAADQPPWSQLLRAVVDVLRERGHSATGLDLSFTSTLPLGSGLSSSAAFAVASTLVFSPDLDRTTVAALAQIAETEATGVPCGIMDQMASVHGKEGHAILLDARTNSFRHVPIPPNWRFLVVDSGQSRTLAGSEYGTRAAQCAAIESQIGPLREATLSDLTAISDPTLRRRGSHVVTENKRTLDAVEAMERSDFAAMGALISASHRSLRNDFEVSTDQLDSVVTMLEDDPSVAGARLVGGGFGGCVVALCTPETQLPAGYRGWFVTPSNGATAHGATANGARSIGRGSVPSERRTPRE